MEQTRHINTVWLKAALLGSIWASVEIVLGSFLHNIGFPATGTLLAALGVMLCVAGARLWPDRGLIWRAGAICALMKSVSPSAVILGPMAGILLEALLLEGSIRLLGRTPLGFFVGGALATSMPIIQKITGVVFTYGLDAARLYVALVAFAAKSLHLESIRPIDLIFLFLGVNTLLGLAAAAAGMTTGNRAAKATPQIPIRLDQNSPYALGNPDPRQQFSPALLFLHAAILPAGFLAIRDLPMWASPVLVAAYLTGSLARYPRARNRFKKPRLWIEFGLVSLIAGTVLGTITAPENGTRWTGLLIGSQMALRATFVVVAFSAISVELRNPLVIGWFLRRGLGQFSAALDVAFLALPGMIRAIGEERRFIHEPLNSMARVLASAAAWLANPQESPGPVVAIITGAQGSGKTTLLKMIADSLVADGISVGGILAPCVMRGGVREGYDIINLRTGTSIVLCRRDGVASGSGTSGPFHFSPQGIAFGVETLTAGPFADPQVVCLDEIGPLELSGGGWSGMIERVLTSKHRAVIFVVRASLLDQVITRWSLRSSAFWQAGSIDPATASVELRRMIARQQRPFSPDPASHRKSFL